MSKIAPDGRLEEIKTGLSPEGLEGNLIRGFGLGLEDEGKGGRLLLTEDGKWEGVGAGGASADPSDGLSLSGDGRTEKRTSPRPSKAFWEGMDSSDGGPGLLEGEGSLLESWPSLLLGRLGSTALVGITGSW